MNIVINYDFIEALMDVNTPFTPMKVMRNNKKPFFKIYLPIYLTADIAFSNGKMSNILSGLAIQLSAFLGIQAALYLGLKSDPYKERSDLRLKSLVPMLNSMDIDTTYDLVKKSEYYGRVTNLVVNEHKVPQLVESKYVLVPSYDYKGDIVDTSMVQEHVVGSNSYVLSIGKAKKKLKPVYQSI
jgi:hypothetical protein